MARLRSNRLDDPIFRTGEGVASFLAAYVRIALVTMPGRCDIFLVPRPRGVLLLVYQYRADDFLCREVWAGPYRDRATFIRPFVWRRWRERLARLLEATPWIPCVPSVQRRPQ